VTITFGLAMREFLFNEKKKIGKGMIWGGGGEGKREKRAWRKNAAFGERARRVTFASQNWFKNDEAS